VLIHLRLPQAEEGEEFFKKTSKNNLFKDQVVVIPNRKSKKDLRKLAKANKRAKFQMKK
jgi:hypothetical protein